MKWCAHNSNPSALSANAARPLGCTGAAQTQFSRPNRSSGKFSGATNHDSRLANHRVLPGTVNRVETHATHRKQTTAHRLTRNVPAHRFLHQSFADRAGTRGPCRAEEPVPSSGRTGATFKSPCFSAPLAASHSARALQPNAGPHPCLHPPAALGYKRAAIISIRDSRQAVVARCGVSRDARNAFARRHVTVASGPSSGADFRAGVFRGVDLRISVGGFA